MAKIRVVIADDHAVIRAGLRLLLEKQADMEVVGEAADARDALKQAQEKAPDVLVLDLTMPGGSSVPMIERIRQSSPRTRVLVLTMHTEPEYLRAALAAGASGYVVKTAAEAELLTAIRAVERGRTFVDLDLGAANLETALRQDDDARGPAGLSPREKEVLELLALGHTNQAIAARLFLSVKTVECYRARLKEKLGLRTRADLVRYAAEMGLAGPAKTGPGADA